mmetsp:Transcript_35650/g.6418  ORF Transcript_35650/g.6418 Transcript_35650/m.6418 type:complete len:120 (+) Transcript_35650:2528-2887(+)
MKRSKVNGDRVTFNTLVNGCVYAKQIESAYKIALDAFKLNVKLANDVYNNLIKNLLNSRDNARVSWANEICRLMRGCNIEPDPQLSSQLQRKMHGENQPSYPGKRRTGTFTRRVLAERN